MPEGYTHRVEPVRRIAAAVFSLVFASIGAAAADEPPNIERFQLPSGIRVVIMQVPDAQRQAIFTFLPLTLASDESHCAQWAHLVEHMLLRTTDPLRLSFGGVQLNGETTHLSLRLESFADKDQWVAALQRHCRWLVARQLDPEALVREKSVIAEEERFTVANGATGKFAIAAWNQIVRLGLDHAAVHEDVQQADFHAVQDYVASHVPVDDSVMLAMIGPVNVEDAKKEITRVYGQLDVVHAQPAAPVDPARLAGTHRGTWDLQTRHLMQWRPLPDRSPATLAAATAFAAALQMHAMSNPDLRAATRMIIVNPFVPAPEAGAGGGVFMIDCCLADGADPRQVEATMKELLKSFAPGGERRASVPFAGKMLVQGQMPKPDFKTVRAQLKLPMRFNAEGIWLLPHMITENLWRVNADAAAETIMKLDDAAIAPLVDQLLAAEPGTLLLTPKEGAAAKSEVPGSPKASQTHVAPPMAAGSAAAQGSMTVPAAAPATAPGSGASSTKPAATKPSP